jgi:tetratricopeptide (TPR) repeat protein
MHGRALLLVLVVSSTTAASAEARGKHHHARPTKVEPATAAAPKPPPPPGPDDPKALAILARIAKGPDAAARKAAIAELDKLAPKVIDGLGTFLARPHVASVDERRQVLEAIHAEVPDEHGRFKAYKRKSAKEEKADDDLDWMLQLLDEDAQTPGLGEVIADDAAIRALASTRDIHAAALLFDAGFADETSVYRDEVGRYLRKMEPYSVPALILQTHARHSGDRRRYANYQLERIDRQEPSKALSSATGDEALMLAILDAYRVTRYREAVHAVWSKVDAPSPRVRAKARQTWLAYVTGPPPPPAPKKKLLMPGGKLTKKKKPLWLTSRELADNELRKTSNELLHTDYPLIPDPALDDSDADDHRHKHEFHIDLKKVTDELFGYYDEQRGKREAAEWADAKALADKGDLAAAATALDRLLAANPERGEKPAMANVYFTYAKQLEGKQQWSDAAAAYSKAYGLDPKGARATDALAAQYFSLGKVLEAQGKDGGADFRRAIALRPDYAPAKKAVQKKVEAQAGSHHPVWMLYAAGGAGLLALFLLGVGVVRRRA